MSTPTPAVERGTVHILKMFVIVNPHEKTPSVQNNAAE